MFYLLINILGAFGLRAMETDYIFFDPCGGELLVSSSQRYIYERLPKSWEIQNNITRMEFEHEIRYILPGGQSASFYPDAQLYGMDPKSSLDPKTLYKKLALEFNQKTRAKRPLEIDSNDMDIDEAICIKRSKIDD